VVVQNELTAIEENSDTTVRLALGDIALVDDGLGDTKLRWRAPMRRPSRWITASCT
jgi:hypothetical protein